MVKTKDSNKRFCFQTKAWDQCVNVSFDLKIVHRQTDDAFIEILNNLRVGRISPETSARLMATSKQKIEQNGILATRLCSHTDDANLINKTKLNELETEQMVFEAQDSDKTAAKQLDQQTPVGSRITLKIGTQVMLLKNVNVSAGLVNGARGVVTKFSDGLPVVRFRQKEHAVKHERWSIKTAGGAVLSRRQIPLRLAWAFSIHKSQGLTLDCVEMSLARVFEAGQAYVALSRAQSLDTLRVLDFKASQVWADPDVLKFSKELRGRIEDTRFIPLGKRTADNKVKVIKKINKSGLTRNALSKPIVSIS